MQIWIHLLCCLAAFRLIWWTFIHLKLNSTSKNKNRNIPPTEDELHGFASDSDSQLLDKDLCIVFGRAVQYPKQSPQEVFVTSLFHLMKHGVGNSLLQCEYVNAPYKNTHGQSVRPSQATYTLISHCQFLPIQ